MKTEYRVLILEDSEQDAELIRNELTKSKLRFSIRHAYDKETYLEEIGSVFPDVILSDYVLPRFDGLEALIMAKARDPDVPFIIISGRIGDEFASEVIRKGATDYVLKDRLTHLVQAVERAINESDLKRVVNEMEEERIHNLERENREMRERQAKIFALKHELETLRNELKQTEEVDRAT